jgi:signal transduction histidine kinase
MKTIHPEDDFKVQKCIRDHIDGTTGDFHVNYRLVTKTGKLRNVMARGKIVSYNEDDRPFIMAGAISDITEMKRLSDEVNRMHNLESIGLLAGGMSHDFNNLLGIIYGNITFVKMLAGSESAFVEPLTDAEEACERAKELGFRLQAFSHESSPNKEPIAIFDLVEDVAEELFVGSNILHSISTAEDLYPVEADPCQIRRVFHKILTNSKEAMSDGGTVKIEIQNYADDGKMNAHIETDRCVSITLQDEGKGIPEENLPKIFDPYFSTKDTYSQRGMGLGLSMCYSVLKRHGGHISVESTLGIGTRVTVCLPACVEETTLSSEGRP